MPELACAWKHTHIHTEVYTHTETHWCTHMISEEHIIHLEVTCLFCSSVLLPLPPANPCQNHCHQTFTLYFVYEFYSLSTYNENFNTFSLFHVCGRCPVFPTFVEKISFFPFPLWSPCHVSPCYCDHVVCDHVLPFRSVSKDFFIWAWVPCFVVVVVVVFFMCVLICVGAVCVCKLNYPRSVSRLTA